jgi:hypothetical protein
MRLLIDGHPELVSGSSVENKSKGGIRIIKEDTETSST